MASEVSGATAVESPTQEEMISLTAEIVAAYVGKNPTATSDLPGLIETIHATLTKLGAPREPEVVQEPAVSVKRSVKSDAIICLECGKAQKMLKRHLATGHGLTPQEYRAKWNLPYDYPLVAPEYAEKRRSLAKKIGLGRKPAATKTPAKRKAPARKKAS